MASAARGASSRRSPAPRTKGRRTPPTTPGSPGGFFPRRPAARARGAAFFAPPPQNTPAGGGGGPGGAFLWPPGPKKRQWVRGTGPSGVSPCPAGASALADPMDAELVQHSLADRGRLGPPLADGFDGAAGGAPCGDLVRVSI